jgi:hypothetical protein
MASNLGAPVDAPDAPNGAHLLVVVCELTYMIPSPDTLPNPASSPPATPADDHLTTYYREIGISAVAAALNAMVDSMRRVEAEAVAPNVATTKTAA